MTDEELFEAWFRKKYGRDPHAFMDVDIRIAYLSGLSQGRSEGVSVEDVIEECFYRIKMRLIVINTFPWGDKLMPNAKCVKVIQVSNMLDEVKEHVKELTVLKTLLFDNLEVSEETKAKIKARLDYEEETKDLNEGEYLSKTLPKPATEEEYVNQVLEASKYDRELREGGPEAYPVMDFPCAPLPAEPEQEVGG